MRKLLPPRLPDIIFASILLLVLGLGQQMLSLDSDLGRHLTLGNYMLDSRIIPTRDLLSHTRTGLSRPPYEWLSQIIFAIADRLLRLDGVILLTSLTIAFTFSLVYQFAVRRSGSTPISLILVFLAAGASSIHWLPRPHIFTFLFLAIWVELLEKLTNGNAVKLYLFPLIMLFWVNMHGGFIFGILAWMAYFAGWVWDRWKNKTDKLIGSRLIITGTTSLLATVITPDLWRNWEAVLNNRSSFILNRTVETMRPNLTDPSVIPFTLLLILTIIIFIANWKMVQPGHFFLLVGLGIMSLMMARNIPLFAISCVPIISTLSAKSLSKQKAWTRLEERFSGFGSAPGLSAWSVIIASLPIILFAYFNINNTHPIYQFNRSVFPVDAVQYIQENPQKGNMFNEFNWGGYLENNLWPEYNVFLDSQSDFYGEDLMRDYNQIISANDNWGSLLQKYQVDWLIIPVNAPLTGKISNAANWEIVYSDNTSIIGIRK